MNLVFMNALYNQGYLHAVEAFTKLLFLSDNLGEN